MEKRFGGTRLWIGLGAFGVVFLCLLACGLLTLAVLAPRPIAVVGQPAAGEDGAAPPAPGYADGGPAAGWLPAGGPLGFVAYGVSLIFKVAFWGLLLVLLFGLVRRLFWGPRHWCRPGWDEGWRDRPHGGWRAWHPQGGHPRAKPSPANDEEESGAANAEYTGPQV